MNFEEIKNYTVYGRVCVDIVAMPQYSGFVRKVIFYISNRVCIEFIGHSIDDGEKGYEFCCTFSSLEEAVASIENYLDKPVENWVNYTKTGGFPLIEESVDIKQGHKNLRDDIINKKIHIPKLGYFKPNFDVSRVFS